MENKLNLGWFTVSLRDEDPVWTPWQREAMKYLWAAKNPASSKEVLDALQIRGIEISRASVINFLEAMAEAGILSHTAKSGKGGYHGLYTSQITPLQLYEALAKEATRRLSEEDLA